MASKPGTNAASITLVRTGVSLTPYFECEWTLTVFAINLQLFSLLTRQCLDGFAASSFSATLEGGAGGVGG